MSVHNLIEFVQQHYSGQSGMGGGQRNPNVMYAPAPDDSDAIQGERPPVPDWLPEEGDASVIAIDADDVLSLEGELPALSSERGRPGYGVTIDTLAYYLPYHFYSSRWGIYLKTSGIHYVASVLKSGLVSLGDDALLQLAQRILFEHEFFHFVAETACARAEVVAKTRLYDIYYPHPFAVPQEEALANAHSFRKALIGQPPSVKKIVSAWMNGQGPGYRDYGHWLGRGRFEDGCRRLAQYMLQPIGTVPITANRLGLSANAGRTASAASPSETVMGVDHWGRRRGNEIVAEWGRLGISSADPLVVADAHYCLFEPAPQLAENPQDTPRAAWWKQMMETPEYRELHAQTCLDTQISALAAKSICDQWAAFAANSEPSGEEQPVSSQGGVGLLAPTNFLFALPKRNSVPIRLVVDTKIGILKPFPKFAGMRVLVHTNEHPPPHVHIERPPGRPVTRYLWPELTPYPGDHQLSGSEEKELHTYVERFGLQIGKKVQGVYQSQ